MAIRPLATGPSASGRPAGRAAVAGRLHYRLDVLARDVADTVAAAGGWLFDRAMAGWEIDVWLAEPGDPRPLRILGARPHRLDGADGWADPERIAGLAVAADLLVGDRALAERVGVCARTGDTEIAVWGAGAPLGSAEPAWHRLSAAARSFKRQALNAIGHRPRAVADVERFTRTGWRPVDSDLLPVR